jgi:hypothetical protein
MQTFKAICTTLILALALTVPVYAGDIDTPGFSVPAPGGTQTPTASATVPGSDSSITIMADLFVSLLGLL